MTCMLMQFPIDCCPNSTTSTVFGCWRGICVKVTGEVFETAGSFSRMGCCAVLDLADNGMCERSVPISVQYSNWPRGNPTACQAASGSGAPCLLCVPHFKH